MKRSTTGTTAATISLMSKITTWKKRKPKSDTKRAAEVQRYLASVRKLRRAAQERERRQAWRAEFQVLKARVELECEAKHCAEAGYTLREMESICAELDRRDREGDA